MANDMIIEQLRYEISIMEHKLRSAKAVNDSYKKSVSEALRRGVNAPMLNYNNQLMSLREFEELLATRKAELKAVLNKVSSRYNQ
ncbi:hypothetical protein REH76_00690 [Photobacterium damselae]